MNVDYDPEVDKYNLYIDLGNRGAFDLSFPEANQLHAKLGEILTENMITMIAPPGFHHSAP
jgi:hypothetical protein